MQQQQLEVGSLAALFTLIENFPAHDRLLFRGHQDASWKLIPTLYRLPANIHAGNIAKNYDVYEANLIARFFDEATPYLPVVDRNYSNDRALAQHFGVPTRLLDWSEDPLVATYFAVEHYETPTDAALYVILPDAHFRPEYVKGFNSLTAISFRPPAIDRRIPAQRSVFTFHPHDPADQPFVPLDDRSGVGGVVVNPHGKGGKARGFGKVIIPQRLKLAMFRCLSRIGIDRRNLFPGLDGVGADTALRAKMGLIW